MSKSDEIGLNGPIFVKIESNFSLSDFFMKVNKWTRLPEMITAYIFLVKCYIQSTLISHSPSLMVIFFNATQREIKVIIIKYVHSNEHQERP